MKSYKEIRSIALSRKGQAEFDAHMPDPIDVPLSAMTDDRLLAQFTKRIFQAGFVWRVIEAKWEGFEKAFHGFDIGRNAMMNDEDLDSHIQNTEIVRNGPKILTVRDNAVFLSDLAREHGSAAGYIGNWDAADAIGLFELLKKRGSRLGGMTAQYALRFSGYDTFILSKSVTSALNAHGVIDGAATSKTAMRKAQDAFNEWHSESGESYTTISRVLAISVPD
jgi:3-methyladenine DNA glycosylase Tag